MKQTFFFSLLATLLFFAAPALAIGPFTDNGNGTVSDTATGLTWRQSTGDVNGDGSLTSDDRVTWQEALAYCEDLSPAGSADWRLPNIRELKSLVDRTRYSPTIDFLFQCESNHYWSSTSNPYFAGVAWGVDFREGRIGHYGKTGDWHGDNLGYVRCVRGGLSWSIPTTWHKFPWPMFLPAITGAGH